jgi:hypothetical protein
MGRLNPEPVFPRATHTIDDGNYSLLALAFSGIWTGV